MRISGHFPQPVPVEAPLTAAERALIEENPFRAIRYGTYRSPSAISKIIKRDEKLARQLCRDAGQRESDWFGPSAIGPREMSLKLGR